MRSPSRAMLLIVPLLAAAAAVVFLVLAPTARTAGRTRALAATAPDPRLGPDEVVASVLAALKQNNTDDDGIRTTFRFASPANQAVTGPIDRFIPMLKAPPYGVLLNHRSAQVRPLAATGDEAAYLVRIVGDDLRPTYFLWRLSRQTEGPTKGCWMTDSVEQARPPAGQAEDLDRI